MNNKIWYKMVDIKFGESYLTKYLAFQRTLKKGFQIMTLIVSISGILGWKYFENYVWIAFILIAVVQLMLLIENQIIRSNKEIEEISNLRMMYTKYFNKLERLWTEYQYSRITENDAIDNYFELRVSDWEKIESETKNYINKYHNNE